MVVYFGYILLIAFDKDLLAEESKCWRDVDRRSNKYGCDPVYDRHSPRSMCDARTPSSIRLPSRSPGRPDNMKRAFERTLGVGVL